MKYSRFLVIPLSLILFALVACSNTREATEVPNPDIQGLVTPWGNNSPIDARHIVPCRLDDFENHRDCELMKTATNTDDEGHFTISGLPTGTYFILYDSGLSEFDEAMDRWGGEVLRFGDMDWLSEFLDVDLKTEPVEFRVPEGISRSPHEGWLTHYCTLTLSIGDSPFIVAHDIELAQTERELRRLKVDVTPGKPVFIEVQAAYFGER